MSSMIPWEAKLRRGREHLAELFEEITRLKDEGVFAATTAERGRERPVHLVLRQQPPASLSTIIGDAVHNARSALDCLAFAACSEGAAAQGHQLTEKEEQRIAFPITGTQQSFDRRVKECLLYASVNVQEAIRSRQPYYHLAEAGLDARTIAERVEYDQLTVLQRLSNVDKHRQLHLVGAFPSDIYAGLPEGLSVSWKWTPGPWTDGSEVGRWLLPEGHDETPIWPNADVDLVLQEHVEQGWGDVRATDLLGGLIDYVENWVIPCVVQAMRIDRGEVTFNAT